MEQYNEELALMNYLVFYYKNLFRVFEKKILAYRWIRKKYTDADYKEKLANYSISETEENDLKFFLEDAIFNAHFINEANRLLKENRRKIIINRCPNCNKITRTNKSKQCRFCGFDWH